MKEISQSLIGLAADSPPGVVKNKMDAIYTPSDTIKQYLEHFNNFRKTASAVPQPNRWYQCHMDWKIMYVQGSFFPEICLTSKCLTWDSLEMCLIFSKVAWIIRMWLSQHFKIESPRKCVKPLSSKILPLWILWMCKKIVIEVIFMPPLKKEGHIALHMYVGMSVSLYLVQLITQERFAPEASDLAGR